MGNLYIRWFENRKGFSWVITLTGNGVIKASLKIVNTRKGPRVVRTIYLVPKRASEEKAHELFSEYYDIQSFMELLNHAYTLISSHSPNIDPIVQVIVDLSKVVETIQNVKKTLEEVIENDKKFKH